MIQNLLHLVFLGFLELFFSLFLAENSILNMRRIIKIIIIVFVLLFAKNACGQDTICVTRSEMIHYATNAISLKQCQQENVLYQLKVETCETISTQLQFSLEAKNQVLKNQESEITELQSKLKKSETKKQNWKIVSFTSIGVATVFFIISKF